MKIILYTVFLFYSTFILSQTKKFKIERETGCDFKLIVDSDLIGRKVLLSKYALNGVKKHQAESIRKITRFVRVKTIVASKEAISAEVLKVCELKKLKLFSVELKKSYEEPILDTSGYLYYYVDVVFLWLKKQ